MIVEVKPSARGSWLAHSDTKLRSRGKTPGDAIVALKRTSLALLATGATVDVAYAIEWDVVPRRDVAARDKRVLGQIVKWKKHEQGRPFSRLRASTFAWLIDQRFVLPSQPMSVGATATKVRAFMEARPGVTASGQVVGNGRPDCRVDVEALVDADGQAVRVRASRVSGAPGAFVELCADILIAQTARGWTWRSQGGAVSGTARSLARARDDAARASWRALATRLDDDDVARAGAMRIAFHVSLTSAWVVDHRAPGEMTGGHRFRATFAQLKKALGAPHFDPLAPEPLYGWGLRGKRERSAWVGVRLREVADQVDDKDAASYAKSVDEFELAATDEKTAKSVRAWLKQQTESVR